MAAAMEMEAQASTALQRAKAHVEHAKANVEYAKAGLQRAEAALQRAEETAETQVEDAKAKLQRAEAMVEYMKARFEREPELLPLYVSATTAYNSAQKSHRCVHRSVQKTLQSSQETLRSFQETLRSSQKMLRSTQEALRSALRSSLTHFESAREKASSSAVDNSWDWATAVLKPFPFSILELEGLEKAISEPLPMPIPIDPAIYETLGPLAADFVPTSSCPRIVSLFTSFIEATPKYGASESLLQSIWDLIFCNLWWKLLGLASISTVDFDRNVTDASGATVQDSRPDLMLWVLNRLCAMFDEKKRSINDALEDLQRKLANLKPDYYGPVNWIIGVALAGEGMSAWAMRRGRTPDKLVGPLKMSSLKDRIACLKFSINLLRVSLSLEPIYDPIYERLLYLLRPFRTLPPSLYGKREQIRRTLQIVNDVAIKKIHPWSQHVEEGYTQWAFVDKAYGLQAAGLVSGRVVVKKDKYKVVMKTGYEPRVWTEAELVQAVVDVLKGLKALHAAGLVHRDITWNNILSTPTDGYLLIDYEMVWACGEPPLCCDLRAWDDQTLVNGKYTERSDLYLLGKLMFRVGALSPRAQDFQSRLLDQQFATAEGALQELQGWGRDFTFSKMLFLNQSA